MSLFIADNQAKHEASKPRLLKNVLKALSLFAASLLLSACFSLPDLNFFSDDDTSNQLDETGTTRELSEEEQARRDALVAGKSNRPTLASLNLQPVRLEEVDIPELSLAEKRDEYEALLPLLKDPIQKQQVAFRLADIKMLIAEQDQQEGVNIATGKTAFDGAISDYRNVLAEHDVIVPVAGVTLSGEQQALNRKQMDAMYQLTRALDLSAKPDESLMVAQEFLDTFSIEQFDVTPYHIELYFRIGEYYFNRQQYPRAVNYYAQVVDYGKGSSASQRQNINFYAISAYMLGWSHFKLDAYSDAMDAFGTMLDASLYGISDIDRIEVDDIPMPRGELRLVKDSLRIMALTFSYQGNADAIIDFYTGFGARDYEQLIYDELAQQHLDNDRFQDSANVLVAFAKQYPTHPRAIEFYIRHVDAFVLGEFPAKVLLAKEAFVSTYSLGAGVVVNMNTPIGRDAAPYLRDYIKQLAQTEHSIAQGIDRIIVARQQNANGDGTKADITGNDQTTANEGFVGTQISQEQTRGWQLASNQDLVELSQDAYRKAKDYYQNFIRTFEPDPEVAELRFYLGEALFALADYTQAIKAFETYAYIDNPNPKAVEAAYAALLAYELLPPITSQAQAMAAISTVKYAQPLNNKQLSQARFANTFSDDGRAPMVALTLMQALFEQDNFLPAQDWATWLLTRADSAAQDGRITLNMTESAKLVMAHSNFAMEAFAEAETGYRELLVILSEQDPRKDGLIDLLAASIYKQAESLLVAAQLDTASLQARGISNKSALTPKQISTLQAGVTLLQNVVTDTPLSEFRVAAQYDSAVYFALLEDWPKAIDTFIDFRQRFPQNPLSAGIDDQLFFAYEQTEDWPKAAAILLSKHEQAPNTDTGRLALYRAAEYYEKAGDRPLALDNFRRYAHQYPMPMDDANEARFIMSEYYLESGEDSKRRFWLNKLVQAQLDARQGSPNLITPRSTFLASMSAMVFATDADRAFTRIKLSQPLNESLPKKQAALKKAIYEYDRVMSFGSKDYVAAANYQLANLYTTLADDLMNSDRPNGLSALELGQYEILLEEQAYPFEETAIDLHENNIARVQSGLYDKWVKQSYTALKQVMPGRYNKPEVLVEVNADDFE